ncbi:MAG: hypothetical protein AB8G96_01775 [Phycisphaerales bacterium]
MPNRQITGFLLLVLIATTSALPTGVHASQSARGSLNGRSDSTPPDLSAADFERLGEMWWYRSTDRQPPAAETDAERERDARLRMARISFASMPAVHIDPHDVMRDATVIIGLSEAQAAAFDASLRLFLATHEADFERRMIETYARSMQANARWDENGQQDIDHTAFNGARTDAARSIRRYTTLVDGWLGQSIDGLTEEQVLRFAVFRASLIQSMLIDAGQLREGRVHRKHSVLAWICQRFAETDRTLPADRQLLADLSSAYADRGGRIAAAARGRDAAFDAMVAMVESDESAVDHPAADAYAVASIKRREVLERFERVDARLAEILTAALDRRDRRALARANEASKNQDTTAVRPAAWDRLWERTFAAVQASSIENPAAGQILERLDAEDAAVEAAWTRFIERVRTVNGAQGYNPRDIDGMRERVQGVADALADAHRTAAAAAVRLRDVVAELDGSLATDLVPVVHDAAVEGEAEARFYAAKARDGDVTWARTRLLQLFRSVIERHDGRDR